MAERQPPLYMDVSNAYSGDELGIPWRDVIGEGVVVDTVGTALAVSAGAGNTVNVAAGAAWIAGDTNPDLQPIYRVFNDAVVNLGITPDPAQPRIVRIVAQIVDQAFAGVGRSWSLQAIHGAAAASPAAPAIPASAVSLAVITVPAAAASSAAYTITNTRPAATLGGRIGGGAGGGGGGGVELWPDVVTNPGNCYWTVISLSQWQAGVFVFAKDADGRLFGKFKATRAISTVTLTLGANGASPGVTRMVVEATAVGDTESLNPGAVGATVTQDVTLPSAARVRKDVAFDVSAAGIVAGDEVILEILHDGDHTNDTATQDTELYSLEVS